MKWDEAATIFTQALACAEPTPGGGAAAAHTAEMGVGLLLMAIGTTLKRKNLGETQKQALEQSATRLTALKSNLNFCMRQDSRAYERYLWAKRLPKEDFSRESEIQNALEAAALVPADTARHTLTALQELTAIKPAIAPIILADVYCAKHLLQAAIRCAVENIQANKAYIKNEQFVQKLDKQLELFLKCC